MKYDFVQNYLVWYLHGETEVHHGYDDALLDMSHGSDRVNHPNFNRTNQMQSLYHARFKRLKDIVGKVSELKELWEVSVDTYDTFHQNNFIMCATLIWTISDFPAYSMLSWWSIETRTACPYCMKNTDAFTLNRGGKQIWFDSHRKFLSQDQPFRRNKTSFIRNQTVYKSLLPIRTRKYLLKEIEEIGLIRQPITELSNFFKELTSTTVTNWDMQRLNEQILVIFCKLERVFSPSLFDSMEHLPIHLAYEASIAGPVQYQWMYPFERYLRKLNNNVKNKTRVEGSICNAYLVEEASAFFAHYFEAHVITRHQKVPCNLPELVTDVDVPERVKSAQPNITNAVVDGKLEREFAEWFYKYAHDLQNNIDNQFMKDLSKGPLRSVTTFDGYIVNGCKFNTIKGSLNRNIMNFGICIKGSNYSSEESDYYGQLVEVLRLEYPGLPIKRTVLFNCDWFDPTPNTGTKIHREYRIVDVNDKQRFNKYEPFVLTFQATQVVYPSKHRDKNDWRVVMKVKGRPVVEVTDIFSKTDEHFQ
ncbi:uncharacterized protein LOC110607753 [Manihot esculenta]|uniref:uncharacterized protein LOC110607753 n=1 Tax=Manihot esculenta TaxID=3983 RepID=UPI000B5D2999|nr:uncharacterized protein LOC110607753 [Manihot esculenta]